MEAIIMFRLTVKVSLILSSLFLMEMLLSAPLAAQSTATIRGTVTDSSGAVIAGATLVARHAATGLERTTQSDAAGSYQFAALPIGVYTLDVRSSGMQPQTFNGLLLQVGQIIIENVQLAVAQSSTVVVVEATTPVLDEGSMTVGQVIDHKTVQDIPLNGRHFVDLGLLLPGSVTPPANGFLTAPLRGQGSFAFNTAGQREDTVNFMINGINLNDMANGQITFQPSINTVQEFKADNSTYSAEYGRNSGGIVQIATRSGTNDWHGEAFNFLRNEALDARNFFNFSSTPKATFKRNNFGVSLGGPIWKNHTFFFFSYEGLRQRQGLTLSTSVPSVTQRQTAAADPNSDPTSLQLLALIPNANNTADPTATAFTSSATAPVNIDQWTGDVTHEFSEADHLHGYYAIQRDQRKEPNLQGNNLPGFGDTRASRRQIFTLNETHIFSPQIVNEARLGYNRIHITFVPDSTQDPSSFGIEDGLSGPVGLPQIAIASLGLTFGGIRNFPQGRGDYTAVLSDSVSYLHGKNSWKFGGEVRRFNGNSFTQDDGGLGFATLSDFFLGHVNSAPINGVATGFAITQGSRPARVYANSWALFGQDSLKVTPYFTLELGLRWEWNMSPTEADDRSVNFFPGSDSLVRIGSPGYKDSIAQNDSNFEPRLGFSWDMFRDGKTVLRGGYGYQVDQFLPGPMILSGNPPLAVPAAFTASTAKPFTTYSTLLTDAAASGLAPGSVSPDFKNGYVQSYNLNLQREITPSLGMMIGYFGSKGTHLSSAVNLNQFVNGIRPFASLSPSSPIIPAQCVGQPTCPLGNITQQVSNGISNYNALWITGTKRLAQGLEFNASYTWSKSLDYNSRNFQGYTIQDSLNPSGDYGLSDFDARQRFVFSSLYELPFKRNLLVRGWRLSGVLQLQTGNPLNLSTGLSALTGVGNIRPDFLATPVIVDQIRSDGNIQWLEPNSNSVCDPRTGGICPSGAQYGLPYSAAGVLHFGTMERNSVPGPDFKNLDMSLAKTTNITERVAAEFRVEAFDLLNHPNFGNPASLVTQASATPSTAFGVIRNTRFPTGDSGSSRQLQFGLKVLF
jgi:Carboxypeptidase regulatory-like domain